MRSVPGRRWMWALACAGACCWALVGVARGQTAPPAVPAQGEPIAAPAFLPDVETPFLDYSNAWPVRVGRSSAGEIQGVIVPWKVSSSRLLPTFTHGRMRLPSATDQEDHDALMGGKEGAFLLEDIRGLVFREARPDEQSGNGFLGGPGKAAGPDASMVFRFVSGQKPSPAERNDPAQERIEQGAVVLERTWFAYYEPIPHQLTASERRRAKREGRDVQDAAPATRAVVLLMPGLYGTPEPVYDVMILALRENNIGVLRMLSQPSRFTERVKIEIDPEKLDESAAAAASILTNRAAECGLAAEAAWKYLESQKPELKTLPKAIIGTSGGGITLPVVFAREPARYKAAVTIGAGADFELIARRSAYTGDASSIDLRIKGFDTVPAEKSGAFDWEAFDRLYLSHAALDSFHCAKALQGKRVLMIHGENDLAVPASLGDVLWERLGKPERWSYPTGHEGLIIEMVPRDTPKLVQWLKDSGLK